MAPLPTDPTPKRPATRSTRAQTAKRPSPPPAGSSSSATAGLPTTSSSTGGGKGSSIFSRSKEGLRKVSEKLKEKDQGVHHHEVSTMPTAPAQSAASLEALKAYLRIRPCPAEGSSQKPYLNVQNEREVLMRSDMDTLSIKPAHIYSFDRVFPPDASTQASFFTQTTFPLVEKLLHGENGLVFAYGVTNSGKTYTISGADNEGEQGLLPRAVDVVFNSISGMQSTANIKCVGPAEIAFEKTRPAPLNIPIHDLQPSTSESVKLDKNYSYAIFVSCAEVYNDKIYDLLDPVVGVPGQSAPVPAKRQHSMLGNTRTSSAFAASSLAALASNTNGRLTRRALQLKKDPDGNGKYIGALNEVRVQTQNEALALLQVGQSNRQVFATQSNRDSSRSHGIFTIKVVRIHNGAPNDPDSASVSRLSIVDLAGSERNKNTGTQGAQLKEAGQINQSLMVLGQCFQTLRSNQQKLAAAPLGKKPKQTPVPFRHSRLTEIFQSFFVGDGRAVMIVNINPYDTGYEENTHVMRFSAVARDVQTTAGNKLGHGSLRRQISTQFSQLKNAFHGPGKLKLTVPETPVRDGRQSGAISGLPSRAYDGPRQGGPATAAPNGSAGKARTASDECSLIEREVEIEVVDEEEEDGDDDESEDGRDALVDSLFEQLREARQQLFEAELRNRTIAEQVRAQIVQEMADAQDAQEAEHREQIAAIYAAAEEKANSKLDIMAKMVQPQLCGNCGGHAAGGEEDVSMEEETPDQSFVSALDTSRRVSSGDPFVVRTGASFIGKGRKGHAGDASFASSYVTSPLGKAFVGNVSRDQRETTADSEDVLSRSMSRPAEDDEEDEDEAGDTTRSTNEVEEDDEDGGKVEDVEESGREESEADSELEVDDDLPSGDQADQDSPSESETESESASSGSDFEGGASSSSEDESQQPIRRASAVRRKTGSPVKRGSPNKGVTPRNTKQKISPRRAVKGSTGKAKSGAGQKGAIRTPLGQRSEQDGEAEGEEEEESLVKEAKPKKKRALGRKIALEEDMPDPSTPISGAEVRRLNKAGRI